MHILGLAWLGCMEGLIYCSGVGDGSSLCTRWLLTTYLLLFSAQGGWELCMACPHRNAGSGQEGKMDNQDSSLSTRRWHCPWQPALQGSGTAHPGGPSQQRGLPRGDGLAGSGCLVGSKTCVPSSPPFLPPFPLLSIPSLCPWDPTPSSPETEDTFQTSCVIGF